MRIERDPLGDGVAVVYLDDGDRKALLRVAGAAYASLGSGEFESFTLKDAKVLHDLLEGLK